jgi:predicted nucleic acid-binding protein
VIVIEASAMVDALVGEPASPNLLALLADEEMHAPALLDFEVASALRGHLLGHKLKPTRVEGALDDFMALRIERYHLTELLQHVIRLRSNFTAYDAAYVVLAQALGAPLVTSDAKLIEAKRFGVKVKIFASPE